MAQGTVARKEPPVNYERFLRLAADTAPAVVLQSSYANGLGIIRDLGRMGIPVLALDKDPRALGFSSRHATGRLCPDPLVNEEELVTFLVRLGAELPRRAVVFPTHDEYVWAVARHAQQLSESFLIPFCSWERMQRVYDKLEQLSAARRARVATPRTVVVRSRDDLEDQADAIRDLGFPAIFKPVESLAFKRRFARPVLVVPSPAALEEVYATVDDCGPLMLQEIIPGADDELWTVGSYVNESSRPLAVFTGRKLRQHPRGFGTARFAEAVWVEELADAGLRLLAELGYHGVSQVEFKRDPRDGSFKLMEVNGRHWLWHSLATACGVNLSHVAYSDALHEPYRAPRQDGGGRWMLALKDVPDSLREGLHGELSPGDWLHSLRGTRVDGIYSLADPKPGLLATWRLARFVWRRRSSRRWRDRRATAPDGQGVEL